MRKLMWFSLGAVLMCAVTVLLNMEIGLYITAAAVVVGVIALILRKHSRILAITAVVCLGLVIGMVFSGLYDRKQLKPARELENKTLYICAVATDYSFRTDSGSAVSVDVLVDGKEYRAQLYLNNAKELKPGDRVEGEFKLQYTGGEDGTYHWGKGIFLLCKQKGEVAISATDRVPVEMYPAVIRYELLNAVDMYFPEDTAFFARALLLGDRTDVDYELNTAFKVTGISHIIAVSGMHVSILASVVYLLAGKRRSLMAALGIPVVCLFAAVVGFTPSITRACIMQVMLLIALVTDRDYDPLTALAVAALIMVGINPVVVSSVSFQLSFGCMAGIFLFSSKIYDAMAGLRFWADYKYKSFVGHLRHWICGSLSITIGAMFFTTALCAYHFRAVSLIGLLTNLLVLWLVGLIFPGVLIVCLCAFICAPLAGPIADVVSMGIGLLLGFVKWLAQFPLCAVYTHSDYVVLWLVMCYCAILLFLLLHEIRGRLIFSSCVLALCMCLVFSWIRPNICDVSLTVLDVGQGQSVIISAKGRHFLVDCGGSMDDEAADNAAETLLSRGIFSLDGVFLTHYDRDHAGGLALLLQRVPAQRIYLPPAKDDPQHLSIAERGEDKLCYVHQDLRLQWDGCTMDIFAPVLSNSDNESGICILFQSEKCDILITGDLSTVGEALLMDKTVLPDVDILVAGHHGSRHSTGQKLLDVTKPEYVFISVGKDNTYGHPSEEVLERLQNAGCIVKRTDQDGNIEFRR